MATDKRFVVKNGLQTENINFVFNDAVLGSSNITATMLSSNTLSFSGSTGQLFSITDSMTGVIFAVNDISGVPSIEVYDDGRVYFAETFGNVTIGNSAISSSRTSTSTTTGILQVAGGVGVTGNINAGGTRNLFTGSVGIGTSTPLGTNANVFSVYGSAMIYGNLDLANPAGGTSGIYFNDGTYQTTAFTGAATPSFGPEGTVQFAGAGNTFSGNGDSFFWDTANSRLGIGTNSPTNVLTVRSTATPAWFNTLNSAVSSNNYEIIVGNGASTGTTVGYVNNTAVPYGYLSTGTNTRNITVAANGRVGIGGVTAPRVLLDVGGGTVVGASWAGNSNFINPPANGLAVQGSVGIGTYTPLNALDVRGGVGVTAASNFGGSLAVASLASNGAVSGTTGTFTGALYGASFNTAGTATVNALVSNGVVSGTTGTFTGALYSASFNTAGTATVNALTSNSSVTAASMLVSAGAPSFIIRDNNSAQPTAIARVAFEYNAGTLGFVGYDSASIGALMLWNTYSGNVRIGTNDTERIRIDTSGRVGIGTIAPSYSLDVQTSNGATIARFKDSDSTYEGIVLSGDTNGSYVGNKNIGSGAGEAIYLQNSINAVRIFTNDTERARIDNSGRVGIGTTSPTEILDVSGNMLLNRGGATSVTRTLSINGAQQSDGTDFSRIDFVNYDANDATPVDYVAARIASQNQSGAEYGSMIFSTSITGTLAERMRIDANGRVGIATTAPGSTLDVNGVASFRSAVSVAGTATVNALTSNGAVSGTTGTFSGDLTIADKIVHSGDTNTAIRFPAADTFTIETNGAEQMRVDSNGNVGIGTSTVNYKLQVNGSFAAKTKSFVIDHPTKQGYKLRYGSLESPYHGIRLTGEEVLSNKTCVVQLPDYVGTLVDRQGVNIQITNIKHGKTLWVDDIDLDNNCFTVATDQQGDYGFFWSFTAVRKDIEPMIVEYPV